MSLEDVLVLVLQLCTVLLIARALLSWFRVGFESPFRPVVDLVNRVTDPVVLPIRRMMPTAGGFDFSTMILVFGIQLLLIPLVRNVL